MDRLDDYPSPSWLCRYTRRHRHDGGEGPFPFPYSRPLPAWWRAIGAVCLVLLLLSCAKGDRVAGGTSETETGTASGNLVLKGGAAAQGARVTLFSAGDDTAATVAGERTAVTDASGAYRFDSLAFDTYNMTAIYVSAGAKDTLAASRLRIEVAAADRNVEVGVDTLRGPGAVSARVLFLGNPVEEALCYVPGTSYLALTDSGGHCLVSSIPPGRYRLSIKADGYLTARAPDSVVVATDDTVRLGDVPLELDDRLAPPKPTGLNAAFDTSTRKVTLSWSRVPARDLAGYALYRDPLSAVTFTRLTPDRLVQDTFHVDSLAGLKPGTDTVLAYRIKSQDKTGEQSGFALFDTVRVRLPGPKPGEGGEPVGGYYRFTGPAASARLDLDSICRISWVASDSAGSGAVRLSVYRGDVFLDHLPGNQPASGSLAWNLAESRALGGFGLGSGSGYRLRAAAISDTSRRTFSEPFSIGSRYSGSLALTAPAAGAQARLDSALTLSWSVTGPLGDQVGLQLYRDGNLVATLAAGLQAAAGSFVWPSASPPSGPGDGYRIRLFAAADPAISHMGPPFSIFPRPPRPAPYVFLYPEPGDTLAAGDTLWTSWVSDSIANSVRMDLYRDSILVHIVDDWLKASGTHRFRLGTDLFPGHYHVRVTDMGDTARYARSPEFWVKSPRSDPFEPDDTLSSAKTIATDGIPQHRVVAKGERDWIRIEAAPGKRYLAKVSQEAFMDLVLADSSGRMLARGAVYSARVSLDPAYAGPHYLRVAIDSQLPVGAVEYQVNVTAYDTVAQTGRIGISSPAAREVWTVGQAHTIVWEADRAGQGNMVALSIHDDLGPVRSVGIYVDNTGSYEWTVPADLQPWDRYHIRLQSMGNGPAEAYPISAVFTIRAPAP